MEKNGKTEKKDSIPYKHSVSSVPEGNIADIFCDTFLGLTGECNVIKNWLKEKPWNSKFLPLKVVDAILRGISQVVFANNPITGFLILVGLFSLCSDDTEWNDKVWVCVGECVGGECVGKWEWELGNFQCPWGHWDYPVGLAVLACSAVALITATTYKQPLALVEDGITQFNAVLVGSVVTNLYPALYGGELDLKTWVLVLVGAATTVIVQTALGNILASVKAPFVMKKSMGQQKTKTFGIVSLTLPFNIVCCVIMTVLVRTHVKPGSSLGGEEEHLQVVPHFLHNTHNTTEECVYKPNVTQTDDIQWSSVFVGAVRAMGEVYAVDTLRGSVLMYIGVAIFSPLLAVVEFTGALIGSFIALVVSPPPYDLVYAGVWGYCPLLTAGALGGFFVVLTPHSVPATLLAIVSTSALQSFLIPILEVVHIPVFTIPFVLTTWIFLLLTTENQTVVRADNITTPEGNMITWRRENRRTIAHFAQAFSHIHKAAGVHAEGVKEDANSRTKRGV